MVGVVAEARLCRPVMLVQGLTELVDVSEQDSGGFRLRALDVRYELPPLDLLMAVIAVCLAPAVHPIAADVILTSLAVWAMRNGR